MKTLKSEITTLRINGINLPARREKNLRRKVGTEIQRIKALFLGAGSVNIQTTEMAHKKSTCEIKKCVF